MAATARLRRMGRLTTLVCGVIAVLAPELSFAAPHAAPAAASEPDDGYYDRGPAEAAPAGKTPHTVIGPLSRIDASPDQGVAGYASVFFVRPQRDGVDVPGHGRTRADAFCRDQRLGPALAYASNGHALRDVLCRRK